MINPNQLSGVYKKLKSITDFCLFGILAIILAFGAFLILTSLYEVIQVPVTRIISTFRNNSSFSGCQSSNSKLGVQAFLEASELIHSRFLKKRKDLLIESRSLSQINPWDLERNQFFWHYFPPTLTCPHHVERIGKPSDGGKWVCGLELFEKDQIYGNETCIVYSFGVSGDSSFEEEILQRTNCSVYAFDFSVNKMNLNSMIDRSRVKFTKKGLWGKGGESDTYFTLGEFMKQNNHHWIDYLKIDIEGSEYESLEHIVKQFGTFPFGHLNVEVHLSSEQEEFSDANKDFQKFFRFWEILEDGGLRAFIWEDNFAFIWLPEPKPLFMEYGFINIKALEKNRLLQF